MPVDRHLDFYSIKRRTFLQLAAVTGLTGCTSAAEAGPRITVCGAGIVGASIAYRLAKAGAAVTLIDKDGAASHCSGRTFAWINATYAKQPRAYHRLSQQSVAAWHDLADELSIPMRWAGSLEWFGDEADQRMLDEKIAEQAEWGEPARMVDPAEFAELAPNVSLQGANRAAYSPRDGSVDPITACNAMIEAARALGADIRIPCELYDVSLANGRLQSVSTSTGAIETDHLVLATGATRGIVERIADTPLPQRSTPGVIATSTPMRRVLNRIVVAPGVHLHQRGDGRIVMGEQAGPPDTEAHAMRLENWPQEFPTPELAAEHAARIQAIAERFVPALAEARFEDTVIGWRPIPEDGLPVIGPSPTRPQIYLAIMHSGVTLAPIAGQHVASELLDGEPLSQLAPFRPDRFASGETLEDYNY